MCATDIWIKIQKKKQKQMKLSKENIVGLTKPTGFNIIYVS